MKHLLLLAICHCLVKAENVQSEADCKNNDGNSVPCQTSEEHINLLTRALTYGTRQDETDLDILTKKVKIDYSSIRECKNEQNEIGYLCGKECLLGHNWCNVELDVSCGSFTTNNVQLCSNTTFWAEKSCEIIWPDRSPLKFSVGRRCSGSAQHCIYPWYLTNNYYYERQVKTIPLSTACQDKSDQVFSVKQICNEEQYVEAYNDSVCSGENDIAIIFDFCGSEAEVNGGKTYGTTEDLREYMLGKVFTWVIDYTYNDKDYYDNWLYNDTRTNDYIDPHNCSGSCSEPGYGCQACTNPEYFHCTRNNTEVCIHPELVCNDHPDCDNAVDENLDECYGKKIAQRKIENR